MRRSTLLLAAIVVLAAAGGCDPGNGEPAPGLVVVDRSVPNHELLDDVLIVDAQRAEGALNFSYVPETRPDGLTGLSAHVNDGRVLDGYQLAGGPVFLLAQFTPQPTGMCAAMRKDPGSGACVREDKLAADDPAMRNLVVYFTRTVTTTADTNQIQKFWSTVPMVPSGEAVWFTELLAQAMAAPKMHLG